MTKFNIDDLVMLAGRPDRKGLVRKILSGRDSICYYDVTFFDGQTGNYAEMELKKAIIAKDPWMLFANNQHKGYEEFGLVTTFHKVRNTTNNTLSTLRASRTDFKPYQYKPLVKFLNSPNRRILVADEVGLGKTIEAGHIMLELAARGELKNAMIICPKSLKDKWQIEMREKFNFIFKITSSNKELLNDFKHSKETGSPLRLIVTYGAARTKTADRRDLSQELNPFILELQKSNQFFDLLVCDEAHYVRNTNLTHRGLRKIIDHSKAVVFLTATPLMTGIDNLYHILSLLDQEMFYNNTVFQNAVNLNKPFIRALNQLNSREDFLDIKDELLNSEISQAINIGKDFSIEEKKQIKDFFQDDPLFNRVVKNLEEGKISAHTISNIQKDLTDLNSLNHLYTRSRKREVFTNGKIAIRKPYDTFVKLNSDEINAYNRVIDKYSEDPLALVTKKRQVSSCIPAYFMQEEDLKSGNFPHSVEDTKYNHLKKILDEVVIKNDKKIIIFAFFRKTLLYLKSKIEKEGIRCSLMYGGTKDRQEVIDQFRENDEIKVFLSSQVGTEGVDLQFCNAIVNYDLPWNPMVVEQRIGRIDRIGQKEEKVNIYTLVLKSTIEEQIYRRLLQRINVFKESVGDLESILADEEMSIEKKISVLESELYGTRLTEEERQEKIDNIAIAIENQKKDLDLIKRELTDSMVNDVYFQNAINSIIKNQQYITQDDVIGYVSWFFREKFPTILFNKITSKEYQIIFPKNNRNILLGFMENSVSMMDNNEMMLQFILFKQKYYGKQELIITFDQNHASDNPKMEYINAYHPLIASITNFIEETNLHINQVFHLSIPAKKMSNDDFTVESGEYVMCVYKIIIERFGNNIKKKFEYQYPVILDANSNDLNFLPEDEARFFFGQSQKYATEINSPIEFTEEVIDQIRPEFIGELNKIKELYETEESIKLESFKQRSLKQINQYFTSRIERLKDQINEKEDDDKILPIFRKNLADAESEFEKQKEGISDTKLFVDNALISISHVQII